MIFMILPWKSKRLIPMDFHGKFNENSRISIRKNCVNNFRDFPNFAATAGRSLPYPSLPRVLCHCEHGVVRHESKQPERMGVLYMALSKLAQSANLSIEEKWASLLT